MPNIHITIKIYLSLGTLLSLPGTTAIPELLSLDAEISKSRSVGQSKWITPLIGSNTSDNERCMFRLKKPRKRSLLPMPESDQSAVPYLEGC